MKSTLVRTVAVLAGLGVPLAAGAMVWFSRLAPYDHCGGYEPAKLKGVLAPSDGEAKKPCCCEIPTRGQLVFALAAQGEAAAPARTECHLFGGSPQRNMVNTVDKGIPAEWSVEEGKFKNVLWAADLGNKAYGGPVIGGGKIYVGTNNGVPRDPKIEGHKAVLMCFDEKTGKYLWQIVHDFPPDETFKEGMSSGLCSTPVYENGKVWYVTPGAEIVCATQEGKVAWKYDLMKEQKVMPFHLSNCSPLIVGDFVMVITGNGVDHEDNKVHNPKAPSFVAIHKETGKIAWQSDLPGDDVVEGQWSNPSVAVVGGKPQVIFPGGDGVLYSLDPKDGKLIWKFDVNPGREKGGERTTRNYFIATPAIVGDRLYIGSGVMPEHPQRPKFAHVLCLDITKQGDVTPKNLDAKDPANKGSALVWTFGGAIDPRPKKGRPVNFGTTISTCAVHDGLAYVAEESGYLHCLDAKSGERLWVDDLKSGIWGSPYYVDGRVLLGNEDGTLFVYAHGREKKVLAEIEMGETVHTTPVVAGGVLYVMTKSKLYAIAERK